MQYRRSPTLSPRTDLLDGIEYRRELRIEQQFRVSLGYALEDIDRNLRQVASQVGTFGARSDEEVPAALGK